MDNKYLRPMTPFDNLISSKPLRMIKLLIPYTPPSSQRMLAVYVKFWELQSTMHFFQDFGNDLQTCSLDDKTTSPLEILEEMRPYMDEEESSAINQMMSMMSMMDVMKTYQDMNSAEHTQNGKSQINPMDLLKNFLSPEQQSMFETYNTMFSNNDMQQEGDYEDE